MDEAAYRDSLTVITNSLESEDTVHRARATSTFPDVRRISLGKPYESLNYYSTKKPVRPYHDGDPRTSMGLTPLEGLIMGTRSGDVDPGVLEMMAGSDGGTSTK